MEKLAEQALKYGGALGMVKGDVFARNGTGNITLEKNNNGDIVVSYRVCSYTFFSCRERITYNLKTLWIPSLGEFPEHTFGSTNVVGTLNKETLCVENQREYLPDANRGKNVYTGYEDVRLINWDGCMYAITSKPFGLGDGRIPIAVSKLNDDYMVEKETLYIHQNVEKNWMPVENQPLTFLYTSVNPTNLITCNDQEFSVKKSIETSEPIFYKGSTQVRKYKNHYIVLTHYNEETNVDDMSLYSYKHIFLKYDKDWNLVAKSEPFTFMDCSIEFACGFLIDDNDVYLTFSLYDNVAFVLRFGTDFLNYLFGSKKPTAKTQQNIVGIKYPKTDKDMLSLCGEVAKTNNFNGALAMYMSLGAFTKDLQLAKDAYSEALWLVKQGKLSNNDDYITMLLYEDRIIDQITRINKKLG